jgi:predicted anti-sigma-YlaC factor YlaD
MNCTAWNEKLHDHLEGTLSAADTRALEAHLASCPACHAEFASLRALRTATQALPPERAPARDLWPEIEMALAPARTGRVRVRPPLGWKLAAAIALLAGVGAAWHGSTRPTGPAWQVAALAGAPRVDAKSFQGETSFRVGQWLETDPGARARVAVGAIGEVRIEPNSRVRLVDASATDHRLELARGKLSALIWAPPRLFFVNTPSATAVDLGCAYTLEVADNGDGTLHVTSGYVALEHAGRETVIPAGQMCATRRGAGPGTPFMADAPAALRRALDRFDFEKFPGAIPEILAQARAADGVTLWHLLLRAPGPSRAPIFDRLAHDHAPPDGVTRRGVLDGDGDMLARWGADLGILTFTETKKGD